MLLRILSSLLLKYYIYIYIHKACKNSKLSLRLLEASSTEIFSVRMSILFPTLKFGVIRL